MKEPFIFLCSEITRDNAYSLIDWLKDEAVLRYLSDTRDVCANIERMVNRVNLPILTHIFNQNGRFYMAYDKSNQPVGFVRLIKKCDETEIVVVIGELRNWGKMLGTSTIRESLKIAFFEYRTNRVVAKIHKDNIRSIRAFSSLGFRLTSESSTIMNYELSMKEYIHLIKQQSGEIYITEPDKKKLKSILDEKFGDPVNTDMTLFDLEHELNRAIIVKPKELPRHIVTMNSKALLGLEDDDMEVSLVYPRDADWKKRRLSVLSPIGTAILGYGEGDTIHWNIPSGVMQICIKKMLYQPEAAGDCSL